MQMAIIEFELNEGAAEEFQQLADKLLPRLSAIEGFIGAYPAASLSHNGRQYEISYWRDADALARWARDPDHCVVMKRGKECLLKWYRIRVGDISRDWSVGPLPADLIE